MPRIIPLPGNVPDFKRDAFAAFSILKAGGVVVVPTDVGYGIMSCSAEGIERAFAAKRRQPGHTLGIIGTWHIHHQLHELPPERFEITRVLTQDLQCLLAVVAPLRRDHPRLAHLSPLTMERVTKGDTIGIAIAEGPFLRQLGRLNDEDGQIMVGSSANLSGTGQKFRVEDIEEEILEAADLVVDYGLQPYYHYGRAGTTLDMDKMRVIRVGSSYELIRERLRKWWGMEIPEDPVYKTDGPMAGVSIKVVKDT